LSKRRQHPCLRAPKAGNISPKAKSENHRRRFYLIKRWSVGVRLLKKTETWFAKYGRRILVADARRICKVPLVFCAQPAF